MEEVTSGQIPEEKVIDVCKNRMKWAGKKFWPRNRTRARAPCLENAKLLEMRSVTKTEGGLEPHAGEASAGRLARAE